jgi:hypothetical protein
MPWDVVRGGYQTVNSWACDAVISKTKAASVLASIWGSTGECAVPVHCILYSPQPFSLDVQPDDGLLEAETCSC